MNEQELVRPQETENERSLKVMSLNDFYEQNLQSAIYWDLVQNAHLSKK